MTDHHQLLAEFVRNGSDTAFRELVARYINFVHSTALRLVDGDSHLAEDVTQTVFIHLANNAGKLSGEPMLGGWLHRDTCFVASKIRRSEERRRAREREAALMTSLTDHSDANLEKLTPILDEAINQLGNEDRNAILLRFYEQRNFQSVGAALVCNEDAARMRVTRALEKLHRILERRGVTLSATALGTALATGTVSAAPTALLGTVTGAALTSAATAGTTATLLQLVTMTKVKALIAVPCLVAGIAATLLIQSQADLREKEALLKAKDDQIALLQLQTPQIEPLEPPQLANDSTRELLQLRGEVGVLKKQLAEALAAKPKSFAEIEPQLNETEKKFMVNMLRQQYLTRMKINHARNWMMAFRIYAAENDGKIPTHFSEATSYMPKEANSPTDPQSARDDTLLLATNHFQIVYSGPLDNINPETIVFMSAPEQITPGDPSGGWTKVYALVDGSVQVKSRADGNFEDWEKEHMPEELTAAPGQ